MGVATSPNANSDEGRNITVTVTVSTVHPGFSGSAIFTGVDSSGRWVRIVANHDRIPRVPVKGETWQIVGKFRIHQNYGKQLQAEHCRVIEPTGQLLINYLCSHPVFRGTGVGQVKISKLYKIYGDDLRLLLDTGDVKALKGVLSFETAEKLIGAWQKNSQEVSVITFLDQYKVDKKLANKIIKYWGGKAVEKIQQNPYRLLILMSWKIVDGLAAKLDVQWNDRRRLIAAAEAYTYERLDNRKDTLTHAVTLKQGITYLLGGVSEEIAQEAIELALREKAIVGDAVKGYQPLGCAVMEQYLVNRFLSLLKTNQEGQLSLFKDNSAEVQINKQLAKFEQLEGIKLNHEQRAAVKMSVTQPLSVLKGGAGVGKTTVLRVIHQIAQSMGITVHQLALAGRAAQRIRETTGHGASTIVGFLNFMQQKQLVPKAGDLIVIDESSMLDLLLTYRLTRALPDGIRLLFVGDPYQLPPIGPGLVFHVLATSSTVPTVELFQIHRQAASTGIPQVAGLVRQGVVPELSSYEGSGTGISFIESAQSGILATLVRVLRDLDSFNETQILGVTKSGLVGVEAINQTFHKLMVGSKPQLEDWGLAESDPIIYTVNDYKRQLFNGSLGRIERIFPNGLNVDSDSSYCAIGNFDGRKIDLLNEDLGNIELAYAITIHKAQGSQFRRVVVPITRSKLLDRTLIYTALTRATEQVVFVGDRQAFNEAVKNPPTVTLRQVGLSF